MSDKDRQKKEHKRKDKKSKAMREAQGNPRRQQASHQAKGEFNRTDSEGGPDSARTGRPLITGGRT